jgi:hypothetical protein
MRLLAALAVLLAVTVVPFHGETQVLAIALAFAIAATVVRARPA